MDLINMKLPPPKKSEGNLFPQSMAEQPAPLYPWGLSINLDNQTMEKLKLEMPKLDQKMKLTAIVEVTNIHESATQRGEDKSIGLQITDMALGPVSDKED
jgi:hypothetical protein